MDVRIHLSRLQKEALVCMLERDADLHYVSRNFEARKIYKTKWILLTEMLNSIDGSTKTTAAWQKTWSQLKTKVKTKIERTDLDQRIYNLGQIHVMDSVSDTNSMTQDTLHSEGSDDIVFVDNEKVNQSSSRYVPMDMNVSTNKYIHLDYDNNSDEPIRKRKRLDHADTLEKILKVQQSQIEALIKLDQTVQSCLKLLKRITEKLDK